MDRFKYQAFLEEFPFLTEIIGEGDPLDCEGITVKRIDNELLKKVPRRSIATGSCVGIDDREVVSFILADSTILENAVRDGGSAIHNEAHTDNEYWDGETILEAIDRHNVGDNLSYIVVVREGYNVRDHYSEPSWCCTVYKPGRNINLAEVIAEEKAKALEMVRAEANF
ncbi:MAG: hypothetical protein ACTSPX_02920 [Candidatus Thorarchaeota archaeon]